MRCMTMYMCVCIYDYEICQTSVSFHQNLWALITEIDWHWFPVLHWPTDKFPWLERAPVVVICIVCRGPTSLGGTSGPSAPPGPGGPMKRTIQKLCGLGPQHRIPITQCSWWVMIMSDISSWDYLNICRSFYVS